MEYEKYDKINNDSSGKASLGLELLVFSIVISLVIVFVGAIPIYKETKILKEQKKLIEKNIELKDDVSNKVRKYNRESNNLKVEDLEKFENLLPDKDITENYIANINKIANNSESRVLIEGLSMGKTEEVSSSDNNSVSFKKSELNFSARGDYLSMLSFLDSIERSIPLSDLSNIEISSIEEDDDVDTDSTDSVETDNVDLEKKTYIEANISLTYYFL